MNDEGLRDMRDRLRAFAAERDWEQFHTPKNLAMALVGEAGELLEIFQWLTPDEAASIMDTDRASDVREEVADVLGYLIRLADVLDIDLPSALRDKLSINEARYPVERSRGSALKYTAWREK